MHKPPGIKTKAGSPKVFIQPKLSVNKPGDRYEQEADTMAERVMRMPQNGTPVKPSTGLIGASVQRKCAGCEEEEKKKKPLMRKAEAGSNGIPASPGLVTSLAASKGGGVPLSFGTKKFMEHAFSTDFSSVRVHTDSRAAEMSKGIHAKAFTHGSDIYFKQGVFDQHSNEGKKLLAHELTHVVQQSAPAKSIQGGNMVDPGLRTRSIDVQAAGRVGIARQEDKGQDKPTPYLDRLNGIYNKALNLAPVPIRVKIEQANEGLRAITQKAGITPAQIEATVSKAEPVLKVAEAVIDNVEKQQKKAPPPDPAKIVWLGKPPLAVQQQRLTEEKARFAEDRNENPAALPPIPTQPANVSSTDTSRFLQTDPAPTDFESKLKSGQPFQISIRPLEPEIDPGNSVWLGTKPSDARLSEMRFEPAGNLPSDTRIGLPDSIVRQNFMITGEAAMPIRDPVTKELTGYRFRKGDTIFELDRNGKLTAINGIEAPAEVDQVDPIDAFFIVLELGDIVAKVAVAGAKSLGEVLTPMAGRAFNRALGTARAGILANAMRGVAAVSPAIEGRAATMVISAGQKTAVSPIIAQVADRVAGEAVSKATGNVTVRFSEEALIKTGSQSTTNAVASAGTQGITKATARTVVVTFVNAAGNQAVSSLTTPTGDVEMDNLIDHAFNQTFNVTPAPVPGQGAMQGIVTVTPEVQAGFTQSQVDAFKVILSKQFSNQDIQILQQLWDNAARAGDIALLNADNSRNLFDLHRNRFWTRVANNPQARALFTNAGCQFSGGAPYYMLNNHRIIITVDHIIERQTAPNLALTASNLRLSFSRENSVVLRLLNQLDPFQ